MWRPLRLQHDPAGDGGVVDVSVLTSPTATVGDLADALCEFVGEPCGFTLATRWPVDQRSSPPGRDAPLSTHGPPAGATVVFASGRGDSPPPMAPVHLVEAGAHGRQLRCRQLRYGPNQVGSIRVDVAEHVTVHGAGGEKVRVGGRATIGATRVAHGDLIAVDGTRLTVRIDSPLSTPAGVGWTRRHQPLPCNEHEHRPTDLRLPSAPSPVRLPRFPALSASVPLAMGVALWWATGSMLAAAFMAMSVVFVVASAIEARRDARADQRAQISDFRQDLAEAMSTLDDMCETQRSTNAARGLSMDDLRSLSRGEPSASMKLWQRSATVAAASMWVRVGTGERRLDQTIDVPTTGLRDLRRELIDAVKDHSTVDDVVVVDLRSTNGLVIEGPDEQAAAIARSVVAQLCALIGPDRMQLELRVSPDREGAWQFARWLPHLSHRSTRSRLVVVDGDESDHSAAHPDQVVVWVTAPRGPRPADVAAVLSHDGQDGWHMWVEDPASGNPGRFRPEPLEIDEAEPLARRLCPLVPAPAVRVGTDEHDDVGDDLLARSVTLSEVAASPAMIGDPPAVLAHWALAGDDHLAAPIGVDGHSAVVNLDLINDGPHALIAGTTGSGKSELLRTFLVATALHHPPDRVNFLLVDYKGGAAFGALGALPHTVGTITDLSGTLAERALRSLRAELRRRESTVAHEGTECWTGPALLVVVDELATLVAEQPSFVDGLVDLAQRGRSLGVHLVLATQRPAGVVTDAIRANVSMRVCLRVADEDDSRDVIGFGTAAQIARDVPGRALVRLGSDVPTPIQVARCGPISSEPAAVSVEALADGLGPPGADLDRDPPVDTPGQSELDHAVATIAAASSLGSYPDVHRPWLDPLPAVLPGTALSASRAPGTLTIGLIDRADRQDRDPLDVDFAHHGNLLVVGASGAGTSGVVRALASSACRHPGEHWQIYVIDAGVVSAELTQNPAVGDVVSVNDTERVRRLLRETLKEVGRRLGSAPDEEPGPRRLVVIDGIAAMEALHGQLDRGVAMDQMALIARQGRTVGIHLVVTAQRRADVPMSLLGMLGSRIIMRCGSEDEASLWGVDRAASSQAEMPPGRCQVDGHDAQIAWWSHLSTLDSLDLLNRPRPRPRPVETCPTDIAAEQVANGVPRLNPWQIPLGWDADLLRPVVVDLEHHHAVIAGPPRSGVTTTLETLARFGPGSVFLCDDDPGAVTTAVDRSVGQAQSGRPTMLVVDEASFALDGPEGDEFAAQLERLVHASRTLPVRLVVGGDVDALGRSYHDVVARIRRGRTGVLLGGDPELHGGLWHTSPPVLSDLPAAPGRGWLIQQGSASRVQVAHI